jgi:acetyltransferase-like isoleucine patch superfamily enzyme
MKFHFTSAYKYYKKIIAKCFTILISSDFHCIGSKTTIVPPVRLNGQARIKIGAGVFIGPYSWLQVLNFKNDQKFLVIEDRVSAVGDLVISCANEIIVETGVLFAKNVYVSDHNHSYTDKKVPIYNQGIQKIKKVVIKKNAWIGQNVVIGPGATIGMGAVIGANSFVNRNIPDYCVAAGSPAKVLKHF